MMAQNRAASIWEINNHGKYINQILPNTMKSIRQYERINKRICRQKMSNIFNEIFYIYIYIYVCVCVCVCGAIESEETISVSIHFVCNINSMIVICFQKNPCVEPTIVFLLFIQTLLLLSPFLLFWFALFVFVLVLVYLLFFVGFFFFFAFSL